MKRFRRWLRRAVTTISILLCFGSLALLVRSYFARDMITYISTNQPFRTYKIVSGRGGLAFQYRRTTRSATAPSFTSGWRMIDSPIEFHDIEDELVLPGWYFAGLQPPEYPYHPQDHNAYSSIYTHAGFQFAFSDRSDSAGSIRVCSATFPILLTTPLFALTSIALLRRRPRSPQVSGSFCATCGYDLRATPDRCPECGTIAPKNETISN
jgi:hypothetical protein